MKNIILSPVPIEHLALLFFAGLVGSCVFGFVFGIIGLVFANYLGFPMMTGAEEFAMEASMRFYALLGVPAGVVAGISLASKLLGFKVKNLNLYLVALFFVAIAILLGDYFDYYNFLGGFILYTVACSLVLTTVESINYSKSISKIKN